MLIIVCSMVTKAQTDTLFNENYIVVYSREYLIPVEVSWTLYATNLKGAAKRYNIDFKSDKRVKKPRATSADYKRTGFQRGHMCPSADWVCSQTKMENTFLMTNIAPQSPSLNMGAWKQDEYYTRYLAMKYDSIKIECGVIFYTKSHRTIGKKRIAVPDAYWKRIRLLNRDSILFTRTYENK